jgi:hypothetical protein
MAILPRDAARIWIQHVRQLKSEMRFHSKRLKSLEAAAKKQLGNHDLATAVKMLKSEIKGRKTMLERAMKVLPGTK